MKITHIPEIKEYVEKIGVKPIELKRAKMALSASLIEIHNETVKGFSGWTPNHTSSTLNNKMAINICSFDSHFGAKVKRGSSSNEGVIEGFNFKIGHSRMDHLFDRAFEEMKIRKADNFDEINIIIGGDNVDGDGSIYGHQIYGLEATIAIQMQEFLLAMLRNIYRCSKIVGKNGKVNVYCIIGNHGEQRGNPVMHPFMNNWDWMLYLQMETAILQHQSAYKKYSNVAIKFDKHHPGPNLSFKVKGHQFLGIHKMGKNLSALSQKLRVMSFEKIYPGLKMIFTGHYHEASFAITGDTRIIRIGTLVGPSSFSDQLGIYSPGAEQAVTISSTDNSMIMYMPVLYKDKKYGK